MTLNGMTQVTDVEQRIKAMMFGLFRKRRIERLVRAINDVNQYLDNVECDNGRFLSLIHI